MSRPPDDPLDHVDRALRHARLAVRWAWVAVGFAAVSLVLTVALFLLGVLGG